MSINLQLKIIANIIKKKFLAKFLGKVKKLSFHPGAIVLGIPEVFLNK